MDLEREMALPIPGEDETPPGVGGVPDVTKIPAWEGSHLIHGEDGDRYRVQLFDGGYPRVWELLYEDGDDDEGDTSILIGESTMLRLAKLFPDIVRSLYPSPTDEPMRLVITDGKPHLEFDFDNVPDDLLETIQGTFEEAVRNIKLHLGLRKLK